MDMTIDEAEHRGRFDRAVLLFNQGAFYEAHEDWEALWLEADGPYRLWLQGMIQYAAAFVHFKRGFHARGFARLMQQATEKCDPYTGSTDHIDWPAFRKQLEPFIQHGLDVSNGADMASDALPPLPQIGYEVGYAPAPLPIEESDGEDANAH